MNHPKDIIDEHRQSIEKLQKSSVPEQLPVAVQKIMTTFKSGHKVLICGNGGSASDAQHLAAEWVNRYEKNRQPLPAIALTTDTPILTSVSNDFHFDEVFSKQVDALGQTGDILIAISTSGRSKNILKAMETARKKNLHIISFTGENQNAMDPLSDLIFHVPSSKTARIQEMHILLFHILCELVDEHF